jgi:hypothetical protein
LTPPEPLPAPELAPELELPALTPPELPPAGSKPVLVVCVPQATPAMSARDPNVAIQRTFVIDCSLSFIAEA